MNKIIIIITVTLLLIFTLYYHINNMSSLKSVTVYGRSWSIMGLGSSNINLLTKNLEDLEHSNDKSYSVKRINNPYTLNKFDKLLSENLDKLVEKDFFQPRVNIICKVEYKNSKIDTIAFSNQVMLINSKGYEVKKELVLFIAKYLPKHQEKMTKKIFMKKDD